MLCPECGQEKDASRFIWKKNGKQARKPCRDCLNAKQLSKYHSDPEWKAVHRARCDDWAKRNPETVNAISRRWRERNPEKQKAATKLWIAKNREYWREFMRQWNAGNRDRANELRKKRYLESQKFRDEVRRRNRKKYLALTPEQIAAERKRLREYSYANRHVFNARQARRRAVAKLATPHWGQDGIKELYKMASKSGFHVDHIVPLKSDIVCGLHVIYNLQLLPPTTNLSKHNNFDPDTHLHKLPGEKS